jgi:hypothetical protein
MILHTVTCSAFVPGYNAWEQFTRHISRPRRLTARGCERILNRERSEGNKLIVISVQFATYCK